MITHPPGSTPTHRLNMIVIHGIASINICVIDHCTSEGREARQTVSQLLAFRLTIENGFLCTKPHRCFSPSVEAVFRNSYLLVQFLLRRYFHSILSTLKKAQERCVITTVIISSYLMQDTELFFWEGGWYILKDQ